MVKKVHVLNTDMKRPFFHAFSLHVHTFSKEISTALRQRVLCAAGSATRSTAQPLTNPATDQSALSTAFSSGALSRALTPFSFRSSACHPNRSSLCLQQKAVGDLYWFSYLKAVFCLLSPRFPFNSIIQQKVENLLLRVKSKACDECNSSWKHPSLGVSLC